LPTTEAKSPNGFIWHRESASTSTEKKVEPAFGDMAEFIDSRQAGGSEEGFSLQPSDFEFRVSSFGFPIPISPSQG
jgi:hypothetical protein